ncbi:MAG TPA: hypothetical protein VK065_03475 [Brevibacterium sp.]|nr:hypothetical protein [Brevibacterium sp.]
MTRDDVKRDEEKDDRPTVGDDAQSTEPAAQTGEPDAAEAVEEQAPAGEGMLSLDDLLSGAQGSSCSIDGTCD